MIETSLFEGETVCLAAIDPDADAKLVSAWTHDPDISRQLSDGPPRGFSSFEVRKLIEEMQKEFEEAGTLFVFALHLKADDRMVGVLRLYRLNWTHATGWMDVMIGEPDDRKALTGDALALGLRYAFHELNLFRLTLMTPEYSYDQIDRLEGAGFTQECRLREFIYRADRLWDQLNYGILRTEWERKNIEVQA